MNDNESSELFVKLEPFFKLNQQWQDLILGGSLALILQNLLPYRGTTDIDLVGHKFNVWDKQEICAFGSSIDDSDCIMIKIDGKAFDFFIKPNVLYSVIEFKGVRINVQHPAQIIEAKLKYYSKYNMQKHRDDIIQYLDIKKNGYKELNQAESTTNSIEDDLPF